MNTVVSVFIAARFYENHSSVYMSFNKCYYMHISLQEEVSVMKQTELQERDQPQNMEEHQQEDKKPESHQQEEEKQLLREKSELELQFPIGTVTWGKLLGYDWWPGCVISHDDGTKGKKDKELEESSSAEEETSAGPQFWIKWFGDNQLSQVSNA